MTLISGFGPFTRPKASVFFLNANCAVSEVMVSVSATSFSASPKNWAAASRSKSSMVNATGLGWLMLGLDRARKASMPVWAVFAAEKIVTSCRPAFSQRSTGRCVSLTVGGNSRRPSTDTATTSPVTVMRMAPSFFCTSCPFHITPCGFSASGSPMGMLHDNSVAFVSATGLPVFASCAICDHSLYPV